MPPHNLGIAVAGTGISGGLVRSNAGSALGANGSAANALVTTRISAARSALAGWRYWVRHGRRSVLGVVAGSVARLARHAGVRSVGPVGALGVGVALGLRMLLGAVVLEARLGYDDWLDVFGVHGVGGFVGTMLAGAALRRSSAA